jgi:hypothetical protein
MKISEREFLEKEWDLYIDYSIRNGYSYPDVWESMEQSRKNLWQYTTATTGLPNDEIRRLCNQHLDKIEYVKKNWSRIEASIPKKSFMDRIKKWIKL